MLKDLCIPKSPDDNALEHYTRRDARQDAGDIEAGISRTAIRNRAP